MQGQISINQLSNLPYHLGEVEKIGSLRFDNIDMFRMVGLSSWTVCWEIQDLEGGSYKTHAYILESRIHKESSKEHDIFPTISKILCATTSTLI